LLPGNKQDASLLSEKLETKVMTADFSIPEQSAQQGDAEDLTPFTFFSAADLDYSGNLLCITHNDVKNAEKWEIPLKTGIIAGIIFCLLMIGEAVYISKAGRFQIQNKDIQSSIALKKTISNFSEAVDKLTTEITRPDYQNLIIKIIESLPDNIGISEIKFETDSVQQVNLKGIVKASGHSELQDKLSIFLSGLKKNIKPATPLSLDYININRNLQTHNI
jgi:hypothetical protein